MALAKYRLLFVHPFGTAHGMRDGTDSVFVRLTEGKFVGYGEATLPPYLEYKQSSVYKELRSIGSKLLLGSASELGNEILRDVEQLSAPARAAFTMAWHDLKARKDGRTLGALLRIPGSTVPKGVTMMTLGHSAPSEIARKIMELPTSGVLKVKLGSEHDLESLAVIKELDPRPLFLDANQGWKSVQQALDAIATVGKDRVLGIEQPFPMDRSDLQSELKRMALVPIYADESLQGIADLEQVANSFDGINIKLMKCGGLDRAMGLIQEARKRGLLVMLGSMSESSLGCAAMGALSGNADLIDLDGPWLIANDPFVGLGLENGDLRLPQGPGIGVQPRPGALLNWTPIGA